MAEYTYKDVIIDPDDPRIEIGAEYCFGDIPQNLVEAANSNHDFWVRLEKVSVSDGFNFKKEGGGWKSCIIRKKEPKKKYVPFDFTNDEDRAKLRGAWIKYKFAPGYEYQVTAVEIDRLFIHGDEHSPESLLEKCLFIDGTPCGKLVEVE